MSMKNFNRGTMTALMIAVLTLSFAGFGCKKEDTAVTAARQPITLKYWRVFDGTDAFQSVISSYMAAHPNVSIDYRKLTYEEYEKELLNAYAEDRAPDILSLHNTWLANWQNRIMPAPATVIVPIKRVVKTLGKEETIYELKTFAGPTLASVKNDFVDGVYEDVVMPTEQADPRLPAVDQVYGLPLSVDSMAVYYNRDLLANAGIAQPATDWKTFQEHVKLLTKLDENGIIIQSAAAIGTSANIERSSDVLATLMMQNGTQMTSDGGEATFDKTPERLKDRPNPPAVEALVFYTDYANPEKEAYTWNSKMPNSLDAFAAGQTAYFFGYSYHLAQIRNMNPKLNFSISNFPQIGGGGQVYNANYWVETVSNRTKSPNEAWDFLMHVAKSENVQSYLKVTKKPTALRSLISSQLDDLDLSVFAAQAPFAKNWYHGKDARATEQAFEGMIDQMLARENDPKRIVELAATKVNQTIR